jgi:hypothetical protein
MRGVEATQRETRRAVGEAGTDRKADGAFLAHASRLGLLPFRGQRLGEPFPVGAADALNPPAGGEMRGFHDGGAIMSSGHRRFSFGQAEGVRQNGGFGVVREDDSCYF